MIIPGDHSALIPPTAASEQSSTTELSRRPADQRKREQHPRKQEQGEDQQADTSSPAKTARTYDPEGHVHDEDAADNIHPNLDLFA